MGAMLLSTLIAVLSPDKNAKNSPHETAQNEYLELTEGLPYKNDTLRPNIGCLPVCVPLFQHMMF